jgi:glycosyltransferase involved in cell wall biosynthesis
MNSPPKITIGVVTFNRKQFLQRTLDQIVADPYPNKEVIVIDGGSKDGTRELLESYGDKLTRWVSERDRGEYDAWNKFNALATGDIVKWMADDDSLRHGACQIAADWFTAHPDHDMLWGQTVMWEEREFGKMVRHSETSMTDPARLTKRHFLRQQHGVVSVSVFARRRLVQKIGPFRTDIRMGVVPDIFVDYAITGDNGQIKYAFKISRDLLRINRMYGTPEDVLYTIWTRRASVSGLTTLQHRLGQEAAKRNFHPLRALRKLRARVLD